MSDTSLCTGHVPGGTLSAWAQMRAHELRRTPYVLIACIDSERAVSAMPWFARYVETWPTRVLLRDPLVISGPAFVDLAATQQLFTGFDEIWLSERLPRGGPPPAAYITCPRQLDEGAPQAVEDWMADSGVCLGIGDGCGLNFVAAGDEWVRRFQLA